MKTEIKNSQCEKSTEFNFIIKNKHFKSGDEFLFFGNEDKIILIECPLLNKTGDKPIDIFDLLVFAKFFPSKGVARKNWHRQGMPQGFEEFKNIGKFKKSMTILNPIGINYE